ncbi:hypothetical protein N9Y92_00465 [Chlamydiales bacterium]|nr:hypothetical protein [Chlamydiales bacterium]
MIENEHVYCTVKQLGEDKAFCFSEPAIRYYLLHAHKNNLKKAIRKVGRKVLIRRDLFIEWIEMQSEKGGKR